MAAIVQPIAVILVSPTVNSKVSVVPATAVVLLIFCAAGAVAPVAVMVTVVPVVAPAVAVVVTLISSLLSTAA